MKEIYSLLWLCMSCTSSFQTTTYRVQACSEFLHVSWSHPLKAEKVQYAHCKAIVKTGSIMDSVAIISLQHLLLLLLHVTYRFSQP
jgi:hypothetical protein